jgi:UDP-glucose 4-epimerase
VVWDFINKLLKNPAELEILGGGKQVRSYIYIDDAVEATITAWRKTEASYEVYNVASEDWITVDEVAEEVIKAMGLSNVRKTYKPVLHGVGWPGDVKRIALKIDKIKKLGFKPAMNSREAVRAATGELLEEIRRFKEAKT